MQGVPSRAPEPYTSLLSAHDIVPRPIYSERVLICVEVLILDCNIEIGAHIRINLCLICFRHLIRSRAVQDGIFSPKRPIFLHACAASSEFPSNVSTVIHSQFEKFDQIRIQYQHHRLLIRIWIQKIPLNSVTIELNMEREKMVMFTIKELPLV